MMIDALFGKQNWGVDPVKRKPSKSLFAEGEGARRARPSACCRYIAYSLSVYALSVRSNNLQDSWTSRQAIPNTIGWSADQVTASLSRVRLATLLLRRQLLLLLLLGYLASCIFPLRQFPRHSPQIRWFVSLALLCFLGRTGSTSPR